MDTKLQIPESVTKLLGSTIVEDIILGVVWCKNNLGKEWCEENFTHRHVSYTGGVENYPVPRSVTRETGERIISFGDWGVLVGSVCLQTIKSKHFNVRAIIYSE